jgi:membrane-associated phospholipid phosphatase
MGTSGEGSVEGTVSMTASARRPFSWRSLLANLLIVAVLYEIYELSRGLIPQNSTLAIDHADAVWSWEVSHGLFVEPAWQQFWLGRTHLWGLLDLTPARVTAFLNTGYLYVHFVGTIIFLFWIYFFRRHLFAFVRNVYFVTTAAALAIYILYPLAPPRLTPNLLYDNRPYQFIDTIKEVINPKFQTGQIGYNPYAAMPSLHFAWSLILGGTLFCTLRPLSLRLLGLCYPLFMLAVIVISGNHYFLDAMVSVVVVTVSAAAVLVVMRKQATMTWVRWPRWLAVGSAQ